MAEYALKLKVKIRDSGDSLCDEDAMACLLEQVAEQMRERGFDLHNEKSEHPIRDINGQTIGSWKVKWSPE